MQSRKLSPTLGVEVSDIDITRCSDAQFNALRQLWHDAGGLAVVRDQHLTPQSQTDFSRRFGPLFGEADQFQDTVLPYLMPDYPTIYRVSNKKTTDGKALGRARAGSYWHSDVSFRERPAMASLLYAIEIPGVGGDTQFASQTAAYRALSPAMQKMLAPLNAVHDFRVAARSSGSYRASDLNDGDFDGTNRCLHPLVITHPETGQAALFVNPGFTSHIDGFEPAESAALLDFLYAHICQPEFIYRHAWRPDDLLIWDNRSTIHYAIQDYNEDRYMHRSTVIADKPSR